MESKIESKTSMKIKELKENANVNFWARFALKTVFYLGVLLALVYLYHFCHIDGGNFIYNEF